MFLLILASVSLNAMAQVALRKAMTIGALPPVSQVVAMGVALVTNHWLWLGMFLYAASIGLWLSVLRRVEVGAAYPMQSIGFVIAALFGAMFLHESLTPGRMLGIALIGVGVFVVSRTA